MANRSTDITFPEQIIEADVSPRVSPFLGEGTFSGVDIRVHVHLDSIKDKTKELQYQIIEVERQIKLKSGQLEELNGIPIGRLLTDDQRRQMIDLESAIGVLQGNLKFLQKNLEQLDNLPATKLLGELQTISYSVNREKVPVRTLGSVYARGYVRGPRTIGGTMIFTIFYEHVLHEILSLNLGVVNTGTADTDTENPYTTALPDQLPPLNLSLVFANEYGATSHMALYGVEFVLEGSTFSIQDMYSENTVTFIARDMDPMHKSSRRSQNQKGPSHDEAHAWSTKASSLSDNILRKKGRRLRRNPFI